MHMHHPTALPCASTTLRKASRAVSRIYDAALAPAGMTVAQLSILRAIQRAEHQPLSRLAESMVMDRTSLYRALTPMIRSGWMMVEDAPKGRAKLVSLTRKGHDLTDAAGANWDAAQIRFVEAFGVERWETLHTAIADLAAVGVQLAN
ncbi:MAG: MarR family winged helix-turn-helix transcriptional regulator [Caulobacteraceae bacterium]